VTSATDVREHFAIDIRFIFLPLSGNAPVHVEKLEHFCRAGFDHRAFSVGLFEILSPKGNTLGLS